MDIQAKKYMSVAFPPKIIDESIYEKEPIFGVAMLFLPLSPKRIFHI